MIPTAQQSESNVSSSGLISPSAAVQNPNFQPIDLFAPQVILDTYLEYNSHHKMIGANQLMMWFYQKNLNCAMRNALETKDGQPVSETECKELVPLYKLGVNQLLIENQQRTRRLVMSPHNQELIKSPETTFKLIKAILGGEKRFNQIPQFTLEKGCGGWLSRYEDSSKAYEMHRYYDKSSSPTSVKAELVAAPLMRGTDRTNKPFFLIKALDTEDQKEYVQVFYQSEKSCAWYTEGEKIVDCRYLINECGTFDTHEKAIPQLQQLLKTGEISKARFRRRYTTADIKEHEKLGDLEEYLKQFDLSKYKWVLVQNK